MHDHIPRKKKLTETNDGQPRRANEFVQMFADMPPPAMLFDEFWREGELALLFGPSGAGKSMLAVQIGEALARGRAIGSFQMQEKRQRVLYVDLQLSDRRFGSRYTGYHFSENFHRVRTVLEAKKFCDWLRDKVLEGKYKCVIIDDLSAFRETCDGTRETLKLMRHLSDLRDELDISMLVLSDCRAPRKVTMISESEMMRSRILCDAADSVFAIADHPSCPHSRSVVQTRSIERPVWNAENAPTCWLEKTEEGMPGLVFDKRFAAKLDDERVRLIVEIRRRRNLGEKFRDIAADLGISVAMASRLCKKWRPGLEPEPPASAGVVDVADTQNIAIPPAYPAGSPAEDEMPEWEEAGLEKPEWEADLDDEVIGEGNEWGFAAHSPPVHAGGSDSDPPDYDTPRSILDAHGFRRSYDKNDREIFIEREDEVNGTPYVWYRFDQKRKNSPEERLVRVEFSGFGTTGMNVDGPICVFNSS